MDDSFVTGKRKNGKRKGVNGRLREGVKLSLLQWEKPRKEKKER